MAVASVKGGGRNCRFVSEYLDSEQMLACDGTDAVPLGLSWLVLYIDCNGTVVTCCVLSSISCLL